MSETLVPYTSDVPDYPSLPALQQLLYSALPFNIYQYLPSIYQRPECDFLRRFVEGLEETWIPIDAALIDPSVPYDTRRTPEDFLPWLASWVGLVLNQNWPERKRRTLIRRAVDLYLWRGTAKGISDYLEIYTGVRPQIAEPFQGSPIAAETVIGANAVIGDIPEHCFIVTVFVPDGEEVDEQIVREIIESEKPAHTAFDLRMERMRR